jgi:hypothetical protein
MKTATSFLAHNPTLLDSLKARRFGSYRFYEHPTRGDNAPVFMITPSGYLINTGFYDLEDFDLDTCEHLTCEHVYRLIDRLMDKRDGLEDENTTTGRLLTLLIRRKRFGISIAARMDLEDKENTI